MPHGHGVDNCSLRFCSKGRQLDLGESRSPSLIFQWNLLLASHQLWAYVYAFGADGDDSDGDDGDDGDGDDGDGEDGDGDDGDGDDGDDDGVGDGDRRTRST